MTAKSSLDDAREAAQIWRDETMIHNAHDPSSQNAHSPAATRTRVPALLTAALAVVCLAAGCDAHDGRPGGPADREADADDENPYAEDWHNWYRLDYGQAPGERWLNPWAYAPKAGHFTHHSIYRHRLGELDGTLPRHRPGGHPPGLSPRNIDYFSLWVAADVSGGAEILSITPDGETLEGWTRGPNHRKTYYYAFPDERSTPQAYAYGVEARDDGQIVDDHLYYFQQCHKLIWGRSPDATPAEQAASRSMYKTWIAAPSGAESGPWRAKPAAKEAHALRFPDPDETISWRRGLGVGPYRCAITYSAPEETFDNIRYEDSGPVGYNLYQTSEKGGLGRSSTAPRTRFHNKYYFWEMTGSSNPWQGGAAFTGEWVERWNETYELAEAPEHGQRPTFASYNCHGKTHLNASPCRPDEPGHHWGNDLMTGPFGAQHIGAGDDVITSCGPEGMLDPCCRYADTDVATTGEQCTVRSVH